jgi:hypothetical protein
MRLEFSKWLNEDANISSIPQILANAMKDPFVNAVTPQLAKDLQQPLTQTLDKALKPVMQQLNVLKTQSNKPTTPPVNQPTKPGEALANPREQKVSTTQPTSVNTPNPGSLDQMKKDIVNAVAKMGQQYFGKFKGFFKGPMGGQ